MSALALTLLFATAVVPQAQAGVEVATHARAPDAFATQPGGPGVELDVTPTLALGLFGRDQRLVLDYRLRAGWQTGALQPMPALVHTGLLAYAARLAPRLEIGVTGWGRYGEETWLLALTPEGATPELLPQVGRLLVGAGTALAVLRYRTTPVQTLELRAGYDVYGGMDTLARAVLPFGYGPRAELAVRQALDRLDRVTGRLTWQRTELTNGALYDLAGVALDWDHRLAGGTLIASSFGAVAHRDGRQSPDAFGLDPALAVSVTHPFVWTGARLVLEGRAFTGPSVNRLDGTLESRAGVHVRAALETGPRLTAEAVADQVWVLGTAPLIDGSLLSVGLQGSYRVATGVAVQAGLRLYYQQLPQRLPVPGLSGRGWDVFVGLRTFLGTDPGERRIDPVTGRDTRPVPVPGDGEPGGTETPR